ncbi:MAG: hypothetical protein WBA76_05020 [Phormidesmis sp.]
MTNPTPDPSFKPFHVFEQLLLFPWLSPKLRASPFLNIANVIKIPGQISHQGAVFPLGQLLGKNGDEVFQTPTYLSHTQPDQADKEAFMQNSLSSKTIVNSDPSALGGVNQSPEDLTSSGLLLSANSSVEESQQLAALSRELKAVTYQLFDIKAQLSAAKEEIRGLSQTKQRTYDQISERMFQFEHRYKHSEIQRNQIRHAQDQQLERRLQSFIQETIKIALHNTIERLGLARVRGGAIPEPAKRPSTYIVPNRENTGIYS